MPSKMQNSHRIKSKDQSQQSLMATMGKFVKAVDNMDETVMIPSRLMDMNASDETTSRERSGSGSQALIPTPKNGHQADLYSFYTMLNAVKGELASGPQKEEPEDEDVHQAEIAHNAARLFRHHLRGLFDVLHTLTDTAEYVTHRYEENVTEPTSNRPAFPSYL